MIPRRFKFQPVVIGIILMLCLQGICFFSLYAIRAQSIDTNTLYECIQENYLETSKCMGQKVVDHLRAPLWLLFTGSIYLLVGTAVGIVTSKMAKAETMAACPFMGFIAAILAVIIFQPGQLIAGCTFFGAVLGGILQQRALTHSTS